MATEYTIKRGDTLDNIAKQYGTTVQKLASANAIQDPNMIKSGQTLNIPENKSILGKVVRTIFAPVLSGGNILSTGFGGGTTNEAPVMTDTEVNIGNIQPDVKPIKEEVTVLRYKDNPDGTTTNYLSDGTTSTVNYNRVDGGALQPIEVTPEITTPVDDTSELTSRIGNLQKEITDLETSITNRSANRESAYQEAGVFDDIRKLNELKTNLKKAEDEEIAIGLEAEERLQGRGATATEYAQTTSGDLRENLLKQLTASRQVESLTNIINTNTALINQKVDEQYESDVFLLDNKNKRLDNIIKSYGDIMTENQKAMAEEVKQKNAIELENIKFKNELMKSAVTEAIKANPEKSSEIFNAVSTGDISKVYQVSGKNTANMDETVNLVNIVENMLDNERGLAGSAGVKALFGIGGTGLTPNTDKFRTDAKNLASKATLDYYTRLKANGAVFGTMTESEWNLLSNASDAASLGINPETGKSILSDKELRKRLEEYSNAQMKIATAVAMEKLGIDPSILKDKDYLDIRENYYKRYIQKAYDQESQEVDYTQQDTGATNFIQKEEGFSPTAYQDQAGVWTIGYGTTKINGVPVKQGDTVSEEQAKQIALEQAVNDYSTFADKLGDTELTPNQFTALNSFEYNLGSGVWNQPTGQQILQAIANKDFKTASTLMQKFVNVKNPQTGKLEPNQGLIARRQREGQLLFS